MDDETVPRNAEDVQRAAHNVVRWTGVQRVVALLAGLVIVGALAVSGIALWQQGEIRDAQRQQKCIAEIHGQFFAHISQLLTVPLDQRQALAELIEDDGKQLSNLGQVCP